MAALFTIFTYWQGPYFLNLASSFRVQLAVLLSLLSLPPVFLFPGRRKALFVAIPAMIWFTLAGYFLPLDRPPSVGASLSVAVANIDARNNDLSRLEEWLRQNPVDIVGLLEVTPPHLEALRRLGYSHAVLEPRESNFGLALLCRTAPAHSEVVGRDTPVPSILAQFQGFRVLLTHPPPPLNRELRRIGDEQVESLVKALSASPEPTLFMGDVNATAWDLRSLPLLENGFRDARRGFGLIPTWPVGKPLLAIPIDHIFVDEHWSVVDCRRGPDIGSDHYPLRVELQRKLAAP